jgi:hypothetical protein
MPIGEYFRVGHGQYYARTLADSISPDGVRLTTLEARFPRFILAEMNTHRVFSRNSASSRAIPTEKLIAQVEEDPFVPATFNKRVTGMGIGTEADEAVAAIARHAWFEGSDYAVDVAKRLNVLGLDKSRVNRVLEPFMWHTAIISSTEWWNFFALRCPPGDKPDKDFPAQWEMQQIAILMRNAMKASTPQSLDYGWWHLPLVTDEELQNLCDIRQTGSSELIVEAERNWCMVSSRRTARVSFDKHTESEPPSVSVNKAGQLVSGGHWSPTEHCARPIHPDDCKDYSDKIMTPMSEVIRVLNEHRDRSYAHHFDMAKLWSGNFRGWLQFRKTFEHEADHSKLLDYEVM